MQIYAFLYYIPNEFRFICCVLAFFNHSAPFLLPFHVPFAAKCNFLVPTHLKPPQTRVEKQKLS